MVNWKTNLDNFASVKVFLTDADIDNIIQIVNSVRNPSRSYLLSHGMIVGGLPFSPYCVKSLIDRGYRTTSLISIAGKNGI